MKDKNEFYTTLGEIDGLAATEINRLMGDYDFTRFVVKVSPIVDEHDSLLPVIVRVSHTVSAFPERLLESPIRRTALEDYLARKLGAAIDGAAVFDGGGQARRLLVPPQTGQKVLPRSTVQIANEFIDVRLRMVMPMIRDGLDAGALQALFFEQLPKIVQDALLYCNMDLREVDAFIAAMEDADEIRRSLAPRGWIGFVGDGAMLSRVPGTDLPDYEAEQSLRVDAPLLETVTTERSGELSGMGLASGITLILGDVRSGRVDLIRAMASGIYNHIAGDGREYVVTMPDAVYIAAERERSVQRVDIGCFDKRGAYTAEHADALRGQAASLVEALEAGARVILMDEADSAPGFLGGDDRIATLAGAASSTPFAARAKQMAEELGVSTIVGGQHAVGSFIPVADRILLIQDGVISDITARAKAQWQPALEPSSVEPYDFTQLVEVARWIIPSSIDASVGRRDGVIAVRQDRVIEFGRYAVDLGAMHQVADAQQALTIGLIIEYAQHRYLDQPRPVREVLDLVERDLSTEGLDHITRELRGDLARPRRYEIAAALNRLPSLRVSRAAL